MRFSLIASAVILAASLSGCMPTSGNNQQNIIAAAIDNPNRSAADRERDERDQPAVTLALLGLQPGNAVVDLLGGGGYYAELLAGVVGPQGMVILQNNQGYAKWVKEQLQERYVDNTAAPISVLFSEVDDLQLQPDTFDAALMVMSYHDLYYYNPERGFDRTDVPAFFAQVHAALKPGGKLMIIDHAAPDGTGVAATQDTHRIDPAYARADIESNGFTLIKISDALRNPDDPRTDNVFAKDIRGNTERFILVFEKT